MTKYFSKDTPLASLERMMMSVPGFQKRGGGMMVLCRFHYKKEDVDCAYCQSYMRHTCQASVCPYIPERLEAGTVSYQELAEGCLHMAGHQKLWNRLSSLPKGKSLPLVLEPAHRRRLSEWLEAGIATSCPPRAGGCLSALFPRRALAESASPYISRQDRFLLHFPAGDRPAGLSCVQGGQGPLLRDAAHYFLRIGGRGTGQQRSLR